MSLGKLEAFWGLSMMSEGSATLRVSDPFRLGRIVRANRTACASACTTTSTVGECALSGGLALRME